jgi:hypothetical protein
MALQYQINLRAAVYSDYIGDGFDGYMGLEELRVHLHGLLEFPADLVVENERPRE